MPTKPKPAAAVVAEPVVNTPPAAEAKVEVKPVKVHKPAAKKPGTALVDVSQEMARLAAMVQATEKSDGVPYVSTKAGEFKFQDTILDNPMRVVLLGYSLTNMYYGAVYDEDNPQPPVCAAVSEQGEGAEDEMAPLAESPEKQADKCADCEQNVFGSDSRGKGKACKNQRRLALVSCRSGEELEAINETSDVVYLRVPPASLSNFRKYVKQLAKVKGLPPLGVITDIGIQKRGGGHELTFDFVADVPKDKLAVMLKLNDAVQEQLVEPVNFEAREVRPKKPMKGAKPAGNKSVKTQKFV